MIYPTRLAVLAAAAGAPFALMLAIGWPAHWYAGLAWPVAVLLLTLIDAAMGSRPGQASLRAETPRTLGVGETADLVLHVALAGAAPAHVDVAVDGGELVDLADDGRGRVDLRDGKGDAKMPLTASRRGTAHIASAWLRWAGPLGLAWKQRRVALDRPIAIVPDIRPVRDRGARLFERVAVNGLMTQLDRGDGTDFDALVEFRAGMDRRAIDWKHSARHQKLHAKEFRSERNNQIMFAIDAGRQMTDPIAGLPRLDRVVTAMLTTGWVALKLGDRVGLHAFDARPRISSGLVSGGGAFAELQRLAARIDYSGEETNYTFALTSLAARLTRRSLIVLFTEFTDPTSAEFMVRAAARMVQTHLLLVVVLRDEELESIIDRPPVDAGDVARAVTAAALLRDRVTVLSRLRHLGAHVIEADHDRVDEQLVAGYVAIKRRNLL